MLTTMSPVDLKVVVNRPAPSTIEGGTVATVVSDELSVIVVLVGCAAEMLSVIGAVPPFGTVAMKGVRVIDGATTLTVVCAVAPPEAGGSVPVIVEEPMERAVTGIRALVAPGGIETLAGTVATAVFPELNATFVEPETAALMVALMVELPLGCAVSGFGSSVRGRGGGLVARLTRGG